MRLRLSLPLLKVLGSVFSTAWISILMTDMVDFELSAHFNENAC